MSIKAVNWALDLTLTPSPKLILVVIGEYADEHGFSFPGIETIARRASVSERTAIRLIGELAEKGFLTRERRHLENGNRTSNGYRLIFDQVTDCHVTNEVDNVTAVSSTGEPPVEPPVDIQRGREATVHVSDWLEFWDLYPKKVSKPAASKAWTAAIKRGASPSGILTALRMHLPHLMSREQKFIPHPATWLNQEQYNDEPLEPSQRTDSRPSRDDEIRAFLDAPLLGLDQQREIGR